MMPFGSGNDEDSLLLLKGVTQLIPCVIAALFAAANIKVDLESLPKILLLGET
jgi:hypothetical protein